MQARVMSRLVGLRRTRGNFGGYLCGNRRGRRCGVSGGCVVVVVGASAGERWGSHLRRAFRRGSPIWPIGLPLGFLLLRRCPTLRYERRGGRGASARAILRREHVVGVEPGVRTARHPEKIRLKEAFDSPTNTDLTLQPGCKRLCHLKIQKSPPKYDAFLPNLPLSERLCRELLARYRALPVRSSSS